MKDSVEMQIVQHEEKLRLAMLQSDVSTLDELLSPDLIFTSHLGQLLTKEDDLRSHLSGVVKIQRIIPIEQQVKIIEGLAIVNVRMHISGSIAGNNSEGDFRFTRVWAKKSGEGWHVVMAHSSAVV